MARAVVFPGQGSQFSGMADPWEAHEAGAGALAEVSEAIGRDVVTGCRDDEALASTEFVQPALLACDIAAFRVLRAEGLGDPVGVAGHSLGEFAAIVAGEAVSLSDAVALVRVRGAAMQRAVEERPGAMVALMGVGIDEAQAMSTEARGDDVLVVANENSPVQVVVSGSIPAVERLAALAQQRKVRAVRLRVAGAFHSDLMRPAVDPVQDLLEATEIRDPVVPIAENVTGELVTMAERLRELLAVQVVSPVRWDTGIRALANAGATTFIEAGPGEVLTKLTKRIVPEAMAVAVGSPEAALEALSA